MTSGKAKDEDLKKLRAKAEKAALEKYPDWAEPHEKLASAEAERIIHELRVHQIELEMQNDELRRTQAELEASKTRYFELFDMAPVGYLTVTEKNTIREANLAAAKLFGVPRSFLTEKPVTRFIFPDDQDTYYLSRKALFETGMPQNSELRMVKSDGTCFHAGVETTIADDSDDIPQCKMLVNDISERVEADLKIKTLLKEKELLLREVHHRVKNNLSTISALLQLQADTLTDTGAVVALIDAESRVQSMQFLYDILNQTQNLLGISSAEYFSMLVDKITSVFPNRKNVRLDLRIDDFVFDAKLLSSVGILVNELLTNAMKHGFTENKDGVLSFTISKQSERVSIMVGDNGGGLPGYVEGRTLEELSTSGFGLKLVAMLTAQLDGTMRIECDKGTRFILEFSPAPPSSV